MKQPNIKYSSIRFTMIEVTAILNVLKHSRDFGQGSAPEDIVSGVISKIEAGGPISIQNCKLQSQK